MPAPMPILAPVDMPELLSDLSVGPADVLDDELDLGVVVAWAKEVENLEGSSRLRSAVHVRTVAVGEQWNAVAV